MSDTMERVKLPDFHPVIFANGEDDDLPGVAAAIENKPVYFLERLYQPGEPILVTHKKLILSNYIAVEDQDRNVVLVIGDGMGAPHIVRIKGDKPGRDLFFRNCNITFNQGMDP